ncbi:uncharacterized protein At2g39795, mitochondrial [Amborella trichopoda]|uniref:Mitochondrial glycoprotein n=1 Tax=Amborella trichopoda TaxID=13333 RepID=W1PLN0_AMBTC|nr:uncharacterized protein At2g39795, mitochondrial [Amborella trichopoda]ERN08055.1 hypothetical protein AMTR_s00012p00263410 [Amborella trichopoda]|eukprot:XP_006846380.1 uncharacterized protein At2g39795, mitochondrial [Amborella trichopoda]
MAFSASLRRGASSAISMVSRSLRAPKVYHSGLVSSINGGFGSRSKLISVVSGAFSPELEGVRGVSLPLFYCSVAKKPGVDEKLLKVIESEIKCAEESDYHDQKDEIPDGFPFEIEDNPGQQTISLSRKYGDETIRVEVHMPDLVTGEGNDSDDDGDDESKRANQSSLSLIVNVSKGDGLCLEFGCTAYPDEVTIDAMSVKEPGTTEDQIAYVGPDFADLDENLQKAFHKYLELRGIKGSTTNFLHEYMINKDSREYLNWLNNLKKFVEK